MKLFARLLGSLLALLCPALAVHAADTVAPKPVEAIEPATTSAPFLRIERLDAGTVQLQVAARKCSPANGVGPTVWLVAASHLGETGYYQALQKHLEAQDLVLFEGVGYKTLHDEAAAERAADTSASTGDVAAAKSAPHKLTGLSSLQVNLAKSLGLVFQLEAIEYDRPNFRNSDLSLAQLQKLMEEMDTEPSPTPEVKVAPLKALPAAVSPILVEKAPDKTKSSAASAKADATPTPAADAVEPANLATSDTPPAVASPGETGQDFQQLMGIMNGSSFLGSLANIGVRIIAASPQLQAVTKLTLIETLGRLKGDLAQMRGLPPSIKKLMQVLIAERNKIVIADLRAEMRKPHPPASIAIFYGAGHMDDLEHRLKTELHYQSADEVWFPAISLNTAATGLDPSQVAMIQSMIRSQMQQMLP